MNALGRIISNVLQRFQAFQNQTPHPGDLAGVDCFPAAIIQELACFIQCHLVTFPADDDDDSDAPPPFLVLSILVKTLQSE